MATASIIKKIIFAGIVQQFVVLKITKNENEKNKNKLL